MGSVKQLALRRVWKLPLIAWVALVVLVVIVGNVVGSIREDRETEKYAQLAAEHAQVETEFQKAMASLTAEPLVEANVPAVTEAPIITSAPTQNVPTVPTEYLSALSAARNYSEIMHMSKKGVYDQLTSQYGEGVSAEAAQYAIENLTVDWKANALVKAQDYSASMHMSKAGIYDQLTSEYGEQFTAEEAQYAVENMTADWNANALAKAQSYQESMSMSAEEIYNQLISEYGEKFTADEAKYAVTNLK